MRRLPLPLCLLFALSPLARPNASAVEVKSGAGIRVEVLPSGEYEVGSDGAGWVFAGKLEGGASRISVARGRDARGGYEAVRFSVAGSPSWSGEIRAYERLPAAAFSSTVGAEGKPPPPFPNFRRFPGRLHPFSYQNEVFSPYAFRLEDNGTPWLLFDDRGWAVVLSPASNFMVASMRGDGADSIGVGLNQEVVRVPAGFSQSALLVFAKGINRAWDEWGAALRPVAAAPNDADIGLRYLGYWTDNGAYYYYNYDPAFGYAGTLEKVVEHYRRRHIPIRYLQLDSWWYDKTLRAPDGKMGLPKNPHLPEGAWNRYGGLWLYQPDPAVFPDGLDGFERKIGLPLITHNRWIDPASPYHKDYDISGYGAVDPRWWNAIMSMLHQAGVVCYEQDWLNVIYEGSPQFQAVPGVGHAFSEDMAEAAAGRTMSVQYCMPLPRHFLEASLHPEVTTIRPSGDRFEPKKWDHFLYGSRLAASVGVWPWTDVFMSGETDNLLIASLSSGMVGTGDAIGKEVPANLARVARPDGVLVKPDVPLLPADEVYEAEAEGKQPPMVAWTHSDHRAGRTLYVFAYNERGEAKEAVFTPSSLGMKGPVVVLETGSGRARRQSADRPVSRRLAPGETTFFEVTACDRQGLAFFGDAGKFVSSGRQRIPKAEPTEEGLVATVSFAPGESGVRLFGFARRRPAVAAREGSVGACSFDPSSGRFEFSVSPSGASRLEAGTGDPVRQAVVEIRSIP